MIGQIALSVAFVLGSAAICMSVYAGYKMEREIIRLKIRVSLLEEMVVDDDEDEDPDPPDDGERSTVVLREVT